MAKKWLHTFYLKVQFDGGTHAFFQFNKRYGYVLLRVQGGTDSCEQMGIVRRDNVLVIQFQGADKSGLQFGKEVKRTSQECNMSADRFTAGKTGDGLVYNCLENRS